MSELTMERGMTTATREKPVLFNDAMVRAILDGRKTCTRRLVKHQPVREGNFWLYGGLTYSDEGIRDRLRRESPWKVGDRLWVRECWGLWDTQPSDGPANATLLYRATEGALHENRHQLWRPSILMPRWASRISLIVTAVDPVQIRAIDEQEAKEEGVDRHFHMDEIKSHFNLPRSTYLRGFEKTWESLYPGSWDRNDWVYANEFIVERPTK